ncbi:MAG: hypothetical protein JW932_15665 [Deltaproteobacteria bacterium]|nr:hypothetical protein [Deltaproteobacteria bacterium]
MTDREEYIKKIKAKLDEWRVEFEVLRAKADARFKIDEQMEKLGEKMNAFQSKFSELQKTSGEAWHDIREGLDKAGDSLKEAFKKARSHFNQDSSEE